MSDPIRNVSGTAFWVAEMRAIETARRYPLFRDPWAAALAGTRGREIMREVHGSRATTWAVIMRNHAFDQFVIEGLAEHAYDTVINLGAGLDTRAYRLPLPAHLRWFDVDTPEITEHKRHILRDATARCDYRLLSADLSIDAVRKQTLADITRGATRALVITEGVLEYLPPSAVRELARELHAHPACHTWLCNLLSPQGRDQVRRMLRTLKQRNAPVLFTPEESTEFFRADGWQATDWVPLITHGMVYGRRGSWTARASRKCHSAIRGSGAPRAAWMGT